MAAFVDNSLLPFGSSRFSGPEEAAKAGLFTREPHSLLVGFMGNQPLWYSGMGGLLTIAGARSGKGRDLLLYNICQGIHAPTMIILDIKGGELAAISRNQTADRKFCICWNPLKQHGLPAHRINPLDYICADNPVLVSDTKTFLENAIPDSGAPHGRYFEGRARELLEGVCLTSVKRDGVLTYPALYHAINLMVRGGDDWLDFAFEMSESGFDIAARVEEEIAASRKDSSGGFKGILGEITSAFSCLSDPVLLDSVSPPYDFSFSDLVISDQAYNVYLMPDANFVEAWSAVIKSMVVAAQVYKSRAPSAPRQTWVMDELGQLGKFPLAVKAYTRDAGTGIRIWGVFQSAQQMRALAPDGDTIIPASAAYQTWFGVRDSGTANHLSAMIGTETLNFEDKHAMEAARHARAQMAQAVMQGRDPFRAATELAHQTRLARIPKTVGRPLRTPSELLGMPGDKMVVFADGLSHPLWADRKPYYEQPQMAGRYHPSPFFPPEDRVQIMTRRGPVWRPVIVEPVPRAFAHYPQYANGYWSRIG
ncbi:type IV secretory system conjugative DNA transfer family protein [Hwanghaeella sp. LZ110]|uniref:type IV secretory system conjugative DNA transfer family protein n=1 Tax=Hwanghaeella sp. LZ110 TaxID=3402810 RepID=UPI003B684415